MAAAMLRFSAGARRSILLSSAALAALLLSSAAAPSEPAAAPEPAPASVPAPPSESLPLFEKEKTPCVTCHASLVPAGAERHAALGVAECTDCHQPAPQGAGKCRSDQASHWVLVSAEPKLCGTCHVVGGPGKKHKPILDGKCTSCHEAHGSTRTRLLKTAPVEALCRNCHADYTKKKVVHAPVSSGDCAECHDPHAGRSDPLLVEKPDTLCFRCHSDEDLFTQAVQHSAVREGYCVGCHDPHSGPERGLVKEQGRKLCLPCHDAKAPRRLGMATGRRLLDLTRPVVHKPVASGDCQTCHTQKHSSEHKGLLIRPAVDSCYRCHNRFEDKHKFVHGAAKLGNCAVCHDPHTSENPSLLADSDTNRLCFRCHEDDVTTRAWVHQPIQEGGCTTCHDPHGSSQRLSLKKTMKGNALCRECHKGVGTNVSVKHKVLDRYGCTACHDPHGSNTEAGLRAKVNQLCTACHPTASDGNHVGSFGGPHKLSGGPDPHRAGKEFSCVSCHEPHGSDSPKILVVGDEPQDVCKHCH